MSPIIKVKDGGVHIITGEDDRCECGIDVNGKARDCCEILQDMANRFIDQYRDGRIPTGPILLCEDTVAVTDAPPAPDLEAPQSPS